jgi:hypothetical protein
MPDGFRFDYQPAGLTLWNFMMSGARVRLVQGPRGSAKSTTCCVELFKEACAQPVNPRTGTRQSRTYVIRRTFDELQRTTLATWQRKFPEAQFGPVKMSKPFRHHIRVGDLDWEVVFLALDNEEDLQKLKSAEISSAWVNEFSEIERAVLNDLGPCIGRFPSKDDGEPCRRKFIIADTNPGAEDHWFSYMSGQTPIPETASDDQLAEWTAPDDWEIFIQPPGMFENVDPVTREIAYSTNPGAENLENLPPNYYDDMAKGQKRSWILRMCCNRPSSDASGDPVWPEFKEHVHVAASALEPIEGHPLLIGVDFGRTPGAVIGQRVFDRWTILSELTASDTGARRFARMLRGHLAQHFPGFKFSIWADPAGEAKTQADESSPMMMFRAEGMPCLPAPSNDPVVRLGAVREALQAMSDGHPRFVLSPTCVKLKAAMNGGYRYGARTERQNEAEAPLKNSHSHVADALQYLLIGAGEGRMLLQGGVEPPKPRVAPVPASVMARRTGRMGPGRGVMARRMGG